MPSTDGSGWSPSAEPASGARSQRWLVAHRFHERTGVDPNNLRFCRRRPEKKEHCIDLELTHFVDDHPDVHQAIRGTVEHQFLFGPQRRTPPDYCTHVANWAETEAAVLATLAASTSAAHRS